MTLIPQMNEFSWIIISMKFFIIFSLMFFCLNFIMSNLMSFEVKMNLFFFNLMI